MEPVHEGKCACGQVYYKMHGPPMFVHCCHCRWCQRETGAAFAIIALVESDRVEVVKGQPEAVEIPSESGKGQTIWRCPDCQVAVWGSYGLASERVYFIRVGTLLNPDVMPPDIHIYVSSKQPWVNLDDGKPQMEEFYSRREQWPATSLDRLQALTGKVEE